MNHIQRLIIPLLMAFVLLIAAAPAGAQVDVQCPGDNNGDATWTGGETQPPGVECMHLGAGDGFVKMADGRPLYMFSFSNMTGIAPRKVMSEGTLAATFPAPIIVLDEGDEFYLSLTNVGMKIRPDLFDPHTVHWHGFPDASAVFDGVPDSSVSINMGATLTYYYNVAEPGTYMYHCHVEATEHMQMGMLGNLYVRPAQNGTSIGGYTQFAYNDGDGSTGYDVEYAIQMGSFDGAFHDASETVQPLPFALMKDDYPMLNGRGYPDTVAGPDAIPAPPDAQPVKGTDTTQPESSLIEASAGQKILLRISDLNVTRYYTLGLMAPFTMKVVGKDAKLLRGPTGKDLYYDTNSVTVGGGESIDAIIDTLGVTPGTYFLHVKELNYLRNGTSALEEVPFGGMMTEIRIN
jgi:FtsP/CotA-like multicopper oxidase with cupredoxin domain